jgi:phosphate starvation-inducible PhoH-like protein
MQGFIDKNKIKNLFYEDKIEIIPLAYLRGRSLNKSFIIVDEAQNVSPKQMLMILTRLGKNSKMLINGDVAQTDIRVASGLEMAYDLYHDIPGIGFIEMDETDIVRHPLVAEIVKRHSASLREQNSQV